MIRRKITNDKHQETEGPPFRGQLAKILFELITSNSAFFAKAREGDLRSTSGQRKNAGWIARTTHKSEQVLVERTYTSALTFKSDYAPIYS